MKKIVKYILPIVSSAALAAPVMVSCGGSSAIPDKYFNINDSGVLRGLSEDPKINWSSYNTISIPKNVTKINQNALSADSETHRLETIKHFKFQNSNTNCYIESLAVMGLLNCTDILFSNRVTSLGENAFSGRFSKLEKIDMSCYETYVSEVMYYKKFGLLVDLPRNGIIYVKNQTIKDEADSSLLTEDLNNPFYFREWTIEVKK